MLRARFCGRKCALILSSGIWGIWCGGEAARPATTAPVVTVPPQQAPASSTLARVQAPPRSSVDGLVVPMMAEPTCKIFEDHPSAWVPLHLRRGSKLFASRVFSTEWVELRLSSSSSSSSGAGTISGRTKDFDFGGDVMLADVRFTAKKQALHDGWISVEQLAFVKSIGLNEITFTPRLPRVVVVAPVTPSLEIKQRCEDVMIGKIPWTERRGPQRVFKRGSKAELRDDNKRVVARIDVPPPPARNSGAAVPDSTVFTALVLQEANGGKDLKIAIVEDGTSTVEGWTTSSIFYAANDRDAQTLLLTKQADEMQRQMLAALGGGVSMGGGLGGASPPPAQPNVIDCKRPVAVFVRAPDRVIVGAYHAGSEIPLAPAGTPPPPSLQVGEVPIVLGGGATDGLVPFVLTSQIEQCKTPLALGAVFDGPIAAAVLGEGLVYGKIPAGK